MAQVIIDLQEYNELLRSKALAEKEEFVQVELKPKTTGDYIIDKDYTMFISKKDSHKQLEMGIFTEKEVKGLEGYYIGIFKKTKQN